MTAPKRIQLNHYFTEMVNHIIEKTGEPVFYGAP